MRSNQFTIPIILLIASAGLFFGLINGKFKEKQELGKKVLVYKDALKNATEVKTQLDSLLKKRGTIENDLADLENLLPDSVDTVRMIMDLNGIASRHGILVNSIHISEPVAQDKNTSGQAVKQNLDTPYNKISFSFQLTTSYEKFGEFLRDLERSLRILDITSITLTGGENNLVYNFALSGDTYWLK